MAVALLACSQTEVVGDIDGEGGEGGTVGQGGQNTGGEPGAGGQTPQACDPPLLVCDSACINSLETVNHCGACNNDCLGQPCDQGECRATMLASALNLPVDLVVDGSDAYVVNWGLGGTFEGLLRVPLDGSPSTAVVEDVGTVAYAVAADDTQLFVGGNNATDGTYVFAVDKTASMASPPAALHTFTPPSQPRSLAVDNTHLYWLRNDGVIERMPKTGGVVQQLAPGQPDDEAGRIVLDGATVYATVHNQTLGGRLVSLPKAGGNVTTLADLQDEPHDVFIADGVIYWTTLGAPDADGFPAPFSGSIMKRDLSGGAATSIAVNENQPYAVLVHDGYVYWSTIKAPLSGQIGQVQTPTSGKVKRMELAGGAPRVLSLGHVLPLEFGLAGETLVFIDNPNTGLGGGVLWAWTLK